MFCPKCTNFSSTYFTFFYLTLVHDLPSFLIWWLLFVSACKYLFLELFLLLLFLLLILLGFFPVVITIYLVFFNLHIIFFPISILLQFCIPFLMLSTVPTVAISSLKTGMLFCTLPYWYFTAFCIVFTFEVDAQHIIVPNLVLFHYFLYSEWCLMFFLLAFQLQYFKFYLFHTKFQ